ncbi:MAG TPA: bifunctional riboflavin kinase/FAD synthetase [Acidimicrobiales bacterium]
MKILNRDDAVELGRPAAVAIGVFDGVHLGHQHLLGELRRIADEEGLLTVAVVPDRHPSTIVQPDELPRLLTDLPQRFDLLEAEGVDVVYVLRFDEEQSLQPAEAFVREVVVGHIGARVQLGGEDFHFGHRRKGDTAAMASIGAKLDLKVISIPLLHDSDLGAPISAGAIRRALAAGDVATANRLLGRPYEVRGIVEHGDARGRTIGFPTANVAVPGAIALPSDGVYAGWYVGRDGEAHASAINIGRRPTFYDENGLLLVEAHLIDFDGDLYGEHARVQVIQRLREEVRFSGVDALAEQLRSDVEHARSVLS